ncbi:tripartite tricarboxylate transporter substrate binding protein [Azohydromonas aeria]|uniref:tripartite tricarboxylate transporter substrate binding protein n=1 Tax=Azohydromonas aeria TaxID=2590212 RepID=UPI0012F974F7|nr:tripartite tricarboxylate transporter substrate binding protein [Azohydromonas aeria]
MPQPSLPGAFTRLRRALLALGAALLAGATLQAQAQSQPAWPVKPVTIVVAFSPGGPNDVMARILAAKLSANLGQQFIVENKVGAGGTIGTAQVAKAAADGYTLLFNSAPFVTAPALYGNRLSYDTLRDFTGVTKVAESPLALMTATASPHKTLKGLIATAKMQPGKLNFGSGGVASTSHLAMALLGVTAGVELQHVPYKGGGQSITALMGGEIDVLLDSITAGGSFLSAGRLRALAVTGTKRAAKAPDVPTFAEAGLPEFQMVHWVGLSAPAKTPAPVLDKLQAEVARAMAADDVKARFAELGAEPTVTSRQQFDAFIKTEVERWTRVIREARIQPE